MSQQSSQRGFDDVTKTETTGHEWDGIRELDTPLPRWWLWIFYACIVWSIGYWIAMPAWPTLNGYTKGLLGYSSRASVAEDVNEARAAQSGLREKFLAASSLSEIRNDANLLEFALAGGRSAYSVNCATCHGSGAAGAVGYPNLNDDEWLWGGTLEQIAFTIRHGARNDIDEKAHNSQMPAFLKDGLLTRAQVNNVADYVLALSRRDGMAGSLPGAVAFRENCVVCHGDNGQGLIEQGSPALNNDIWLYGGDRDAIVRTISESRRGVMPAWGRILDEVTVKQLAVYIHSLGGGK